MAWGVLRGTVVIPKATSEEHIKDNLESANVSLGPEDMKAIENIGVKHRYGKFRPIFDLDDVPESEYWDGEM